VYFLEKALTIELQKIRRDLLFVHAAAISFHGRCTIVAGESGAGKSTLCWGLCNEGGAYMSDELAPVDLTSMEVEPYPHAICLKHIAEGGYAAPPLALDTERTMHIPVEAIPGAIEMRTRMVQNVVFLVNDDQLTETNAIEIGAPEAAMRLYVNSLNQLAHEKDGLAAVSRITRHAVFQIMRSAPATYKRVDAYGRQVDRRLAALIYSKFRSLRAQRSDLVLYAALCRLLRRFARKDELIGASPGSLLRAGTQPVDPGGQKIDAGGIDQYTADRRHAVRIPAADAIHDHGLRRIAGCYELRTPWLGHVVSKQVHVRGGRSAGGDNWRSHMQVNALVLQAGIGPARAAPRAPERC
jgi:hypothetical protein